MQKNIYTNLDSMPMLLSCNELASFMNMSKTKTYELLNSFDFPTIQIDRRKFVKKDDLMDWLDSKKNY